jgi:hypothetical protein
MGDDAFVIRTDDGDVLIVTIIIIIFQLDDQVFLDDEEQRNQYVLSDFGRLFFGTQQFVYSRPWHYGQVLTSRDSKW